jgi:hypothetical protein
MPSTSEQRRRHHARNKAAGLCRCGGKPATGRTRCLKCIQWENAYEANRKRHIREKGLCPRCGKNKLELNETRCTSCAAYLSLWKKRRRRKATGGLVYDEWRNQGCTDCPPGTPWPLCAIEAHHLNAKDHAIVWRTKSAVEVLEELTRCIPLCANHHRMRHNGISGNG